MFLRWAVIFFVIAIIAGLFGFTGVAAAATGIAKVLFFIFLAGFLIAFLFYLFVAIKMYRLGKSFGAPTQSTQKPKIRDLN